MRERAKSKKIRKGGGSEWKREKERERVKVLVWDKETKYKKEKC